LVKVSETASVAASFDLAVVGLGDVAATEGSSPTPTPIVWTLPID
jgi:hypothetical protein